MLGPGISYLSHGCDGSHKNLPQEVVLGPALTQTGVAAVPGEAEVGVVEEYQASLWPGWKYLFVCVLEVSREMEE